MLTQYQQYIRWAIRTSSPSRSLFTRMRQVKDLEQIYELLKTESLCKSFSIN